MPLTEEQEKTILAFIEAQAAKEAAAKEAATKQEEQKKEESLNDAAKREAEAAMQSNDTTATLEDAIVFTNDIEKFVEDNKDALPDVAKNIVDIANGKNYGDRVTKANAIRQSLIDEYLAIEANIEALPATLQAKAKTYNALTEDAKRRKSSTYWEIVDVGVKLKAASAKAAEVAKANKYNTAAGAASEFQERFLSLGSTNK